MAQYEASQGGDVGRTRDGIWGARRYAAPAPARRPSLVRAGFALAALVAALATIPSEASPGRAIRSEVLAAGADLRDLPWLTSPERVSAIVAANFRRQPVKVDATAFPVSVRVTLRGLARDTCFDARDIARRIDGPVVVILDGYADEDDCGERNDMTWRLLP